jgi:hypothetical protein
MNRMRTVVFIMGWIGLFCGGLIMAAPPSLPPDYPKALYDEDQVPQFTLPDPLILSSGEKVTSADMWMEKRRPEILALFETHVYGRNKVAGPKR